MLRTIKQRLDFLSSAASDFGKCEKFYLKKRDIEKYEYYKKRRLSFEEEHYQLENRKLIKKLYKQV